MSDFKLPRVERVMESVASRLPEIDTHTYNRVYEAVAAHFEAEQSAEMAVMDEIERVTWREGTTLKDAQKALWDIRRLITRHRDRAKNPNATYTAGERTDWK